MRGNRNAGILLRQNNDSLAAITISAVCIIPGTPPEEIAISGAGIRMLLFSLNFI